MQKAERLVAITFLLLARGKMTAQRLAQILGVSTRTIYRDIITLSLAHVPISMDYGPGGGYYLPEDYHLESAIFTREEAISLVLSADISGNYNLFAGDTDLHHAQVKLEAFLPEEYRAEVKVARAHILFDTSAWCNRTAKPTHLETIRAAVLGSFQLNIFYPDTVCTKSTGIGAIWLGIEPYGLVFKAVSRRHLRTGHWFLVAFCQHCQAFHTFRVLDIEHVEVRTEKVTPHPDFQLRTYWRETRKRLEMQVPPTVLTLRVAPSIRFGLPGDVTILREEADGSALVKVVFESLEGAIAYALSLGADAVILDPPQVRAAVAAAAQAIAAMYHG